MNLTETMAALEAGQKKAQIIYLVHTILYAGALALALLNRYTAAVVLGGANMAAYFLVVRGQVKSYSDSVAKANVVFGLCRKLKEVSFLGRNGLDPDTFRVLEMFPVLEGKNSVMSRQSFKGEGYGLTIEGHEVTFHYPVNAGAGKDFRFLTGTLLTSRGGTAPGQGDWLLLRRNMIQASALEQFLREKGYKEAGIPAEVLGERFQVFTKGNNKQLPGDLAEQILEDLGGIGSLGALRLTPQGAAVYLGNRFYTGTTKVRVLPTEEQITHNPLPERDKVWKFFRYWASEGKKNKLPGQSRQ